VIHIGVPRAAPARKIHGKKRKAAAAAAAAAAEANAENDPETATDEQQHAEQDLDVEDGNELHSASLAEAKVKAFPPGPNNMKDLFNYQQGFSEMLLINHPDAQTHRHNVKQILAADIKQNDAYAGLGTASYTCQKVLKTFHSVLSTSCLTHQFVCFFRFTKNKTMRLMHCMA
jgi:hypothetical protein